MFVESLLARISAGSCMINLKGLKVVVRLRFHGTHLWVLKDTMASNVLPGIHILLTSQRSDFVFHSVGKCCNEARTVSACSFYYLY